MGSKSSTITKKLKVVVDLSQISHGFRFENHSIRLPCTDFKQVLKYNF